MKITCEFSISDRLLPMHNMKAKHKSTHAQVSIGCKPSSASLPSEGAFLMVCSAKNRAGNKYPVKGNVLQVFSKFINEGKLTIRLKNPEHDLIISKCDPLALKCFLNVLKQGAQGLELKREHLSTLVPASAKDVTKVQTKMKVTSKKEYPLTSNFPKTLESLTVNTCNLKRFDHRILKLRNLNSLDLSENVFKEIPVELSTMSLKTFIIAKNQLERINEKVFQDNLAKSLHQLDLSENSLQLLPRSIANLKNLVRLNLNSNKLKFLPYGITSNRLLKYFRAAENELQTLPSDFAKATLDELDLYGNPLQNGLPQIRGRLQFPTLLELSARSVKNHNIYFTIGDIPTTLIHHLELGRRCSCGSFCFESFARVCVNQDLRMISREVVKLEWGGYSAKVEAFLCSRRCWKRYEKNPLMFWRR